MERSTGQGSGYDYEKYMYLLRNYKLGRRLGIGSFGKVKLAKHVLTGLKVAIKILKLGKIEEMGMEEKGLYYLTKLSKSCLIF